MNGARDCCGAPVAYGARCPKCGTGNWECDPGNPDSMMSANRAAIVRQADTGQLGAATVSPSSVNPANVELRFPSKPSEEIRAALKRAGFRWYGRGACWYGRRVALPAELLTLPAPIDEGRMRDPGEDAADRWSEGGM